MCKLSMSIMHELNEAWYALIDDVTAAQPIAHRNSKQSITFFTYFELKPL